jgi:hypothetical protein
MSDYMFRHKCVIVYFNNLDFKEIIIDKGDLVTKHVLTLYMTLCILYSSSVETFDLMMA